MGPLNPAQEVPSAPLTPPAPPADAVPLVRLLAMALSTALESLHAELASAGHPALRPAHGFALNAISTGADTASALAARLGMTKQGAAKLVRTLVADGYVRVGAGRDDGRRKPLQLTARGRAAVSASVAIQTDIEHRWADIAGADALAGLRRALEDVVLSENGGVLPPARPPW
ncbi:MarR family winged helix-turn-helix transcriptional regulator [Geodermatophilus sp. SYSU D00691]